MESAWCKTVSPSGRCEVCRGEARPLGADVWHENSDETKEEDPAHGLVRPWWGRKLEAYAAIFVLLASGVEIEIGEGDLAGVSGR